MPPRRTRSSLVTVAAFSMLATLPACRLEGHRDRPGEPPGDAPRFAVVQGFHSPESVRYDPDQDLFFVSNIFGFGSIRDGNGYIARVSAADPQRVDIFVQGGERGVVLDAPKGMAIHGDTLWVTDIDVVRGFHRVSGAPLATLDLRAQQAQLLNDIAVGPDGALYITDTGIAMTPKGVLYPGGSRVFRVGAGGSVSVVSDDRAITHPNGITWDATRRRWLVVNFDPFESEIYAYGAADTTRTVIARGHGRFDGVEVLGDGRVLYTAWNDSSLRVIETSGEDHRLVSSLFQPADIGVDTRRGRVAIPVALRDQVELYDLPPASARRRLAQR